MSVDIVEGPAILIGYAYRLDLEAEAPLFPAPVSYTHLTLPTKA